MEKRVEQVTIRIDLEGDRLLIQQDDSGGGDQIVTVAVYQVPLLVEMLQEAAEIVNRHHSESPNS